MIALYKALLPGALLSWLISTIVGQHGNTGGLLAIRHLMIEGVAVNWSWPMFLVGTLLAWAILYMME